MRARTTLACSGLAALVLVCTSSAWAQPAAPAQPSAPAPTTGASTAAAAPSVAPAEAQPEQAPPAPSPAPASATAPATASPSAMTVADSPYGNGTHPPPPATEAPQPPPPGDEGPATLLDASADYAIGGMGGLTVRYTRFAHKNAAEVCGEGAIIIDHALTLGGGGCGIAKNTKAEQYGPAPHDPDDRMQFGYGGAIVRYHFFSRNVANLGVGALVGAGAVEIGTWDGSGTDWQTDYHHKRSDAVFVFEPQVGGYANVTRWLRVGATAGYRVVGGVNTKGLSNASVGGPTVGGQIQGGWF